MEALSIVADEVALEGLEGITLPSLWIRLEDRKPKFPLKLDDCTKGFLWRSLASNVELSFYELPVEREDVELFDRFINIDPETGFEIKHKFIPEKMNIYPASIIPENKDGIQGSCVFFKERKDVTKHVRCKSLTPLVSIQEAMEKYGRKLVVVASQALRFRTLIGSETDPDLKLSNESFCLLERIGRGRWQGELQSDLHTTLFKIDPRTMHYFRKSLVKHDLITMQSYIRRLTTGQQQHTILLLLKRFHVNRRSKHDILLEQVSDFLQQLPNQFCPVDYVKKQLNMNEKTLKRVFSCFRFSKIAEFSQHPIEEIDPTAEPVTNKNGTKVLVRCIKLLKPYGNRNTADFDDEDDEDEEYAEGGGGRGGGLPSEGRIMERDILSQAYHIILSSGTKGMSKREVGLRLNIGKLESRVICRHLSKADVIKSFMEDEGRQRTYKFISHKFVSGSNQLQLFAKEQERSKLLCSSSPNVLDTEPDSSKTLSTSKVPKTKGCKTPKGKNSKKAGERKNKDAEEEQQLVCENLTEDSVDENPDGKSNGANAKSRKKKSVEENNMTAKQTQPDTPTTQSTQAECETPSSSGSMEAITLNSADIPTAVEEEEQPNLSPASSLPQSKAAHSSDNSSSTKIIEVESDFQPQRSHETYRLLKRKNLIVEAIRNLKIVEGFFPLQKIISEAEKQEGVNTKCCRKTVLRLVHCLSKEGLLKLYTTTVVQDGVTKKVNIVVHPSIQPNDEKVIQLIDEVRFKISSSYAAGRLQVAEEKQLKSTSKEQRSDALHQSLEDEEDKNFKPTTVPGLGKTFGFQPKMIRLRVIHSFLWYLLYDHPLRDKCSKPDLSSQTPVEPVESNPDTKLPESKAKPDVKESETSNSSLMDEGSGDEDSQQSDKSKPDQCNSDLKVYVDEHSWRRFVPPVYVQKGFSTGWAMLRNILLCLPLSILVQIVQFNYKVDELEDYLSDPVKQHYLVRALPQRMKRQLLYKRKYIHVFYVNLQKLTYMGLLQFGVVERFKDKDQVFIYVKRNATIVDTTTSEPHYWLVQEPPDKPFERRHYVFNTAQDVESFWFDLMCVCLNTPLGVVRSKRNGAADESAPPFVHDHSVIVGMGYLLKGSYEVCDDGSIPGDGRGAGGRDSELFSHLKRNWLWTSHLLNTNAKLSGSQAPDAQPRLKSLLSRSALRMALQAGNAIAPSYLTNKRPLIKENIEVGIEPAFRNQQVVGGKGQKRNKKKKEAVKVQRKSKKEPRKRTLAHDATDHQALKRMTRNRVYWSVQEDSIMMLCSVASDLLNSKLKRPFVPHCVVRDILHAEFDKSKDKTSLSVARRSTYILKNPQTVLNYRICLAEVHQDKALMTLLEENKPADPNDPEACAKAFSEYMRLLRQKFRTIMDDRAPMIPDSQEQIFSQFKVSAIDDGKHVVYKDTISCKEDIYAVVLYNLIQSSLVMTNGQMKSSRSFQTFQTYNKYDQELLCRVFVQCRKRGLYNRRRITPSLEPKRNRCLPILPMSFQMSQSYYRRFSWRIPHSLCTDSFCFLRNLITNGTGDNRPATAFYHETEIRSQASEETCERKTARKGKPTSTMDSHKQTAGEESTTEVNNSQSIMQGEEKPVESDGKIESPEEKITLDEQKIPECSAQSGADDGSSSREQTDNHVPEEPEEAPAAKPGAAPQDPPDLSDMLEFSLNNPGGACVVSLSLMTLGLLSIHVSIPKQIVVVDSSLVDNEVVKSIAALEEDDDDDDDDGEECEGRKRLQVSAHQASHTNYLLMRGYSYPGIVKLRNLNTNDNIVVESCIMNLKLRDTPDHHFFSDQNVPPLDLTKYGPSLLPPVLTRNILSPSSSPPTAEECERRLIQDGGYTAQDIEACAQIRRSLQEAGEKGLDARDLYRSHVHLLEPQSGRTRSLQQYLQDLQVEGQVVQVGSMGVRWVLMEHAEPWLLTVNCKQIPRSLLTGNRHSYLRTHHNIPFARKRCSTEVQREGVGPPAKRLAEDREKETDKETVDGSPGEVTEKPNEDQQPEQQNEKVDEGSGDKSMNLEEGKQAQPEHDGQKKLETEQGQSRPKRTRKCRFSDEKDQESFFLQSGSADAEEKLSFISRPWRFIDGKVNRSVCKGILEAVLYHIMSRPGLTQQALLGHYKDTLQPLAVLEMVQALIDIGCVTKRTLVKQPKPSLFSHSAPTDSGTSGVTEEPDTVFYEPTISCCLRLCRVLPNDRHWNECLT